ncbi:hypothetical protein VNO77_02570 [Canavalia gladiata]|uniref:Uncharacterized protein n=1 Tax=Canavalia gladiata TaxID=3824 RepID=A0AAN9MYS3_CANGL
MVGPSSLACMAFMLEGAPFCLFVSSWVMGYKCYRNEVFSQILARPANRPGLVVAYQNSLTFGAAGLIAKLNKKGQSGLPMPSRVGFINGGILQAKASRVDYPQVRQVFALCVTMGKPRRGESGQPMQPGATSDCHSEW